MSYAEDKEAIERLAVTKFKTRCENHASFIQMPEVVMQIVYDEMFESPKRVKGWER